SYDDAGPFDDGRIWTAAQGAFASICAEHAVALVLAAAKRLRSFSCDAGWHHRETSELAGKTVGVVGAGGIGTETIARLRAFGVATIALTRTGRSVPGADSSVPLGELQALLEGSDYVVVAAPLTEQTRHMFGRTELDRIGPDGWLINVARGGLVDT